MGKGRRPRRSASGTAGRSPAAGSKNRPRLRHHHLLAARLEQLRREQQAVRTEQTAAAPRTGRLPELAARPLDGEAAGAVIA
ncbi:hypothetical protein ACIRNI_28480 [Streptomyces sp. NPDC093546]|uniref:hypothetical protein n=1 Tax=Streptomyces sp. NPDC093546 TaxID=3366040 RepID=UPI00382F8276